MNSKSNSLPEIEMQPVTGSSQITAIGHDAESRTLAVNFKGFGEKPGSLYHYSNVSTELFQELQAAESKGAFLNQRIKSDASAHPYVRVA